MNSLKNLHHLMCASRKEAVSFEILAGDHVWHTAICAHIQSPPCNLDEAIVCKKFLMVASRMCAMHLEKQQNFTVFSLSSVSTWTKWVQGCRDTAHICPGSPCSSSFHSDLSLYAKESSWVLVFTTRHTFLKTVVLVPTLAPVLNYVYTTVF